MDNPPTPESPAEGDLPAKIDAPSTRSGSGKTKSGRRTRSAPPPERELPSLASMHFEPEEHSRSSRSSSPTAETAEEPESGESAEAASPSSSSKSGSRRESSSAPKLRRRAFFAGLGCWVYVLVALWSAWFFSNLLYRFGPNVQNLQPAEIQTAKLTGYGLAAAILFGFGTFCIWLSRAVKTLRRLGTVASIGSPTRTILWFILPPVCLWKPYTIMATLWRAAINSRDWDNVSVPQFIPIWWMAWLAQGLAFFLLLIFNFLMMIPEKVYFEMAGVCLFFGSGVIAALALQHIVRKTTHHLCRSLNRSRRSKAD